MSAPLEAVLARDRAVVLGGLVGLAALSWAYMGYLAWQMQGMDPQMAAVQAQTWSPVDLALLFVMWAVMMVAMMIPSAAPMVLTYATIRRKRHESERPLLPTGWFLAGYIAVWTGFSLLATLAQWGLHEAAILSPMMVSVSSLFGGLLLVSAGVFQWTPLKHACLKHCRSPLGFLLADWEEGHAGAFRMGLKHGSYCAGCCWALMALLFVAGVMNLLWVAAIAAFVLIEKLAPAGPWVGRASGLALIGWGLWLLGSTVL